ncbi:glycosyltransferase family 4 protein [Aggregatilineales bacterium SYSU G02658]
MRIWQLDPANLTPYYNLALCEALAQNGAEVTYFTSPFLYDDMPVSSAFKTETLYFRSVSQPWLKQAPRLRQVLRGLTYPLGHWDLIRRARKHPPDIVHIQWSRLPRLDYWLIRNMQQMGIPVVHTVHDVVPLFDASLRPRLERVYKTVDALIIHAEANRRELLATYPTLQDHPYVMLLPMIAFKDPALPAGAAPQLARQRLHLPEQAQVVGFFGLIKAYKGLDVLAAAWPQVQAALPNAHLLIAGKSDSPLDAALLAELKQMPQTHIADFFIPQSEVWAYHMACNVMVFPYHRITQSAALLSAMQYSLPIIVTDVGGLPELIDGNGWIIPSGDANALAQALITALADRATLEQMGARSREIVEQQHNGTAVATRLMTLYQCLMDSARSG